jgi:hypothetical protein
MKTRICSHLCHLWSQPAIKMVKITDVTWSCKLPSDGLQAAGQADWLGDFLGMLGEAFFSFSWLSKRPGFPLNRNVVNLSISSVILADYHYHCIIWPATYLVPLSTSGLQCPGRCVSSASFYWARLLAGRYFILGWYPFLINKLGSSSALRADSLPRKFIN